MLLATWKVKIEQAADEGRELRQSSDVMDNMRFVATKENTIALVITDWLTKRQALAFAPEIQQYFDECKKAQ